MMKVRCIVVDTYPDFLAYWADSSCKNVDEQVTLWQTSYLKKYPELFRKQVENYEEMNLNWRDIAKDIMQLVPGRLQLMREARDNILEVCEPTYLRATERLGLDFEVTFVIYVGIGCGAGWATTYNGQPSVLLGLENIAEEKWHAKNRLQGLLCHEMGHLAHMKWRQEWKPFEKAEENPLFRLYSEGFAQRCEHVILGKETWHLAPGKEWLHWCEQHKGWLASEFLGRLEKHASVKDFFGSWFSIQGRKQTGYFLGHAFIRDLEKTRDLREIALLDPKEVDNTCLEYLRTISKKATRSNKQDESKRIMNDKR
jgi:hypothetical protein